MGVTIVPETPVIGPPSGPNIDGGVTLEGTPELPPRYDPDQIVGHKTFEDGSHAPITRAEADALFAEIDAAKERRRSDMPDEGAALSVLCDAWTRLKELGWNPAVYAPKDGSRFQVCEVGSTGIFGCTYSGNWPDGFYMVEDGGDLWPTRSYSGMLWRPEPVRSAATPQSDSPASGMQQNNTLEQP